MKRAGSRWQGLHRPHIDSTPPPGPHNLSMTALSARKWAAGFSSSRVSGPPEASRCQNGAATTPDKTERGRLVNQIARFNGPSIVARISLAGHPSRKNCSIVVAVADNRSSLWIVGRDEPWTTVEIGDEKWRGVVQRKIKEIFSINGEFWNLHLRSIVSVKKQIFFIHFFVSLTDLYRRTTSLQSSNIFLWRNLSLRIKF